MWQVQNHSFHPLGVRMPVVAEHRGNGEIPVR